MKKSVIMFSLAAICSAAMCQTTIRGKIMGEGQPLPGATVIVSNSGFGMVSDASGEFVLTLPSGKKNQLEISFVGYKKQMVKVISDTTFTIHLERGQELSEVIIQGIRGTEKSPVTQKTIQRKEISSVSIGQDAQFVLEKLSPSILTISQSGNGFSNYGSMRLRGIDDSRINITLNGAPLNDMIDQSTYFSNMPDFISSMQSVQVQRGVGTSSNGLSSFAGSISFESIDIFSVAPQSEVSLGAGSYQTSRVSAALSSGLKDNKTAFYTRFSKSGSDGYRYNSSNDSYSFFMSGGYKGEKHILKATAFFGNSQNGQAYKPVALSDIKRDPRTNYQTANEIDNYSQWMTQVQHSYEFNKKLSLQSTAYYGGAYGYYPWGFDADSIMYWGYKASSNYIQNIYPLTNDHYGLLSNLRYSGERLSLDGGIHAYVFNRTNKQIMVPNYISPFYYEKSSKNEMSAFAKTSYKMGKLTVYGDVQLRIVELAMYPDTTYLGYKADPISRNWTFINPKLGMTYASSEFSDVYVSYGINYREPARIDILGGYEINAVSDSLSRIESIVRPEKVEDIELGYRIRKNSWQINANLFYMMLNDEIAEIGKYIDAGYVQLRKNMPESYRRGIEVDALFAFTSKLRVSGSFTYMQSGIKEYAPDDDTLVYKNVKPALCPEIISRGAISYQLIKTLNIEFSGRYISEMYMEPTNRPEYVIPSSFVVDSKISYAPFEMVMINLRINNFFNTRYYLSGAPVEMEDGSYEPGYFIQAPRNVFAEVIVRF